MAIRIITDSSADFDSAVARRRNIDVVPMSIQFGDASFLAGRTLSNEVFYKLLQEKKENSRSSPRRRSVWERWRAMTPWRSRERRISQTDRRRVELRLLPAGLERYRASHRQALDTVGGGLSPLQEAAFFGKLISVSILRQVLSGGGGRRWGRLGSF